MIILVMLAGKTQATSFIVVTVYCHGDPNPRITSASIQGGKKNTADQNKFFEKNV